MELAINTPVKVRKSNRWLQLAIVLFALLMLLISEVSEARRFGGGRSMGRRAPTDITRTNRTPDRSTTNAPNRSQQAPNTAQAPRKPWGGVLGGVAAGLGLAALFHMLGFSPMMGEMLGTLLLLLLVAGVFMFLLRRLRRPAQQMAGATPGNRGDFDFSMQRNATSMPFGTSSTPDHAVGADSWGDVHVPDGFDVQGFEDTARATFMRLQKAWDVLDVNSLKMYLTDDMFEEIKQQMQERGSKSNQTDVLMLKTRFLGIAELDDVHMASIEFSGMIREEADGGAQPFCEVWNLTKSKNASQSNWLLAGIQVV